jgi:hypothetical protein
MPAHNRSLPQGFSVHDTHGAPPEETLKIQSIRIERKSFVFTLKANLRGRFLRITEDVNGRRDTIIVPAPGLQDFQRMLEQMARVSAETPEKFASRRLTARQPGNFASA